MRILLLSDRIPPENSGGAEKVAWTLARGLHDADYEVHVIAATSKASFEEIRAGIPTYHLHVQYPSRWNAYLSVFNPQVRCPLYHLYQRIAPDVIGVFNIHNDLTYASLWYAQRLHIPTVMVLQDVMAFSSTKLTHFIDPSVNGVRSSIDYRLPPFYNLRMLRLRYNPLRSLIVRYLLNKIVKVRIAGSEALRQALDANGLHDFHVVHASVDPHDFTASSEAIASLRTQLKLNGRKVILFAGRLTRDKGSHQLLQALERVIQAVPNVTLLMLTRATLEQQGLTVPAYRHLLDYICVGGWMQGETLAAAYQLADVVVTPSICLDVFPTVNLEAMAASKPVIATCYGGSPEAVVEGKTGYIVNPFDTLTFAERLIRLLTDDTLAHNMGTAGYQHLLQHFTPENYVRQMTTLYQRTVTHS